MSGRALAGGLILLVLALFALTPPLPQWPEYHDFADRRAWLGLPNFADTASNALFALAGLAGLWTLARAGRDVFADARAPRAYILFFAAAVLLAAASGWYHLAPDNARLAWDRAAMALLFAAYLGTLLAERGRGARALPWLAAAGLGSVLWWVASEARGAGDLRPWLLAQAGALLAIPYLCWRHPVRHADARAPLAVAGLYLVALLLDLADRPVFDLGGGRVSGHTLKHVVAALAILRVALHLRRRAR